MTKRDMIEYILNSYVTDDWWKNEIKNNYGVEKFTRNNTKQDIREMYEECIFAEEEML